MLVADPKELVAAVLAEGPLVVPFAVVAVAVAVVAKPVVAVLAVVPFVAQVRVVAVAQCYLSGTVRVVLEGPLVEIERVRAAEVAGIVPAVVPFVVVVPVQLAVPPIPVYRSALNHPHEESW